MLMILPCGDAHPADQDQDQDHEQERESLERCPATALVAITCGLLI
jgi:hypothetical protein